MSILTTATRMWLTRSTKPFLFTNEYSNHLPYEDVENLGLYIHIPFCAEICDFCPYCKVEYDKKACDEYVDALIAEIGYVGRQYQGKKKVTGLYFGGGTPALAVERIGEVIAAVEEHFEITEGIGLELHPTDVNIRTLKALKEAGITKISIGIQSFSEKFRNILGRSEICVERMTEALREVPFETVSADFIFALPGQTIDDLKTDIDTAFEMGANHIAAYPFIDFTFTESKVKALGKKKKRQLLNQLTAYCDEKGLIRNSIWTFSKSGRESYSSMTRESFLGFGCSATTLLRDSFKVNTFSVEEYIKCIGAQELPTSLTINFTKRQRMVYWLFWTLYSTVLDTREFDKFFGSSLKAMYGFEFWIGKVTGMLIERNGIYELTTKGVFYYHYYENFYTLSYIDKMWGIMRKEAFPEKISL